MFDAITLSEWLMVRNFGSYGSLIMLDSKARNVVADCSASNTSPACTTNLSSRVATRSCKRSHAEKEKLAEPATLSNLLDRSKYVCFSSADTGGLKLCPGIRRPIKKFFIISSDFGMPWNI